jgi:cation transport regulator ChaC
MSEIRATLEELKSISQEVYNLNKKLKEYRLRKKELEVKVVEYLETNDKPGLRLDNIVFLATEKNTRSRKKKTEVVKDTVEILKRHGVQGDINEVIEELEESRKGIASTVPVLKMKAAGLFG